MFEIKATRSDEINTYMSRDAGLTWYEVIIH